MAAWAPLVPLVKGRLELNEASLGTLLLFGGVGSLAATPFCGGLIAKYGCRRVLLTAGLFSLVALSAMAAAPNSTFLAVSLVVFGASISLMDVSMNVQAVEVEKSSKKAMMSGFHGFWSVGGIVGAGLVTGMLSLGVQPAKAAIICVVGAAVGALFFVKGLINSGGPQDTPAFVIPRGRVLVIGLLCCALFMSEGSVLDWSGVLLNANRGMEPAHAGIGFVAFATMMTVGRLTGDWVVQKLGGKKVIILGSMLAAGGFVMVSTVPSWIVCCIGFALAGLGEANIVPVLFSSAGRQPDMPPNLALAATTTVGYAGGLVGPASIGYVAHATSLPIAFMVMAGLLVAVAIVGPAFAKQ